MSNFYYKVETKWLNLSYFNYYVSVYNEDMQCERSATGKKEDQNILIYMSQFRKCKRQSVKFFGCERSNKKIDRVKNLPVLGRMSDLSKDAAIYETEIIPRS